MKLAIPLLKNFKGAVLICFADTPFITSKTLKRIIKSLNKGNDKNENNDRDDEGDDEAEPKNAKDTAKTKKKTKIKNTDKKTADKKTMDKAKIAKDTSKVHTDRPPPTRTNEFADSDCTRAQGRCSAQPAPRSTHARRPAWCV